MRHALTILFLTICSTLTIGQNLVLNSGFEDSLQCPSYAGEFWNSVAVWTTANSGSSDYFYAGCPNAPTSELPRTGNAYAGITCYDPANVREYIIDSLSEPLVAGTKYYVSFHVSLLDNCINGINELAAYFTTSKIYYLGAKPIILTPQIQSSTPHVLKNGWEEISGTFIAAGGEQYITIGCFVPDSTITFHSTAVSGSQDVYYFIDDVYVSAYPYTSIIYNDVSSHFTVYPNPSNRYTIIKFDNLKNENCMLTIFDSRGQLVRKITDITTNKIEIEKQNLASGLYLFQLHDERQVIATGKLLIE